MEDNQGLTEESAVQDTTSESADTTPEPSGESDSVRGALEKAYESLPEQSTEEAPITDNRVRDPETGKFTKLEKSFKTLAPSADGQKAAKTAPNQATQTEAVDVPISWRKEDAEHFKALPPAVQQSIAYKEAKREQIWNERNMEAQNYIKKYQEIDNVLAPYEEQWALAGVSSGQVIKQFMAWQNKMDNDPQGAIKQLAQSYGINVQQLAQEAPPVDPQYQAVVQELNRVKGYLEQQKNNSLQQSTSSAHNNIAKFASETDASGKPLRPHFDSLYESGDITPIAEMLMAANPGASLDAILSEAYDRAMYSNPKVREIVIQDKVREAEAKRITEMKAKAQKAKTLSSTTSGSPGGAVASTGENLSAREILERTWDNLSS